MPKLKTARDEAFEVAERDQRRRARPVAESGKLSDENPNHKADFNRLLNAAAKSQKPDEQT